jgi:hypothetical protein
VFANYEIIVEDFRFVNIITLLARDFPDFFDFISSSRANICIAGNLWLTLCLIFSTSWRSHGTDSWRKLHGLINLLVLQHHRKDIAHLIFGRAK